MSASKSACKSKMHEYSHCKDHVRFSWLVGGRKLSFSLPSLSSFLSFSVSFFPDYFQSLFLPLLLSFLSPSLFSSFSVTTPFPLFIFLFPSFPSLSPPTFLYLPLPQPFPLSPAFCLTSLSSSFPSLSPNFLTSPILLSLSLPSLFSLSNPPPFLSPGFSPRSTSFMT